MAVSRTELRRLLLRKKAILESRERLVPFARYLTPDPSRRLDVRHSQYEAAKHHRVIAAGLEELEAGRIRKLMISCPPRHGKTRLASMLFPAWYIGRHPSKSIIVATYNEIYAGDLGRAVRDILAHPLYRHVFPDIQMKYGGASSLRIQIESGGDVFFTGLDGSLTGRGGDVILIDDPIKSRKEADSPLLRERAWEWYTNVLRPRAMTENAVLAIIACLTADTAIGMTDGSSKRLDAVIPGDRVISWNGDKTVSAEVSAVIASGLDQTYLIRTTRTEVRANARHPFLVLSEEGLTWTRTCDLRPGMRIVRHGTAPIRVSPAQPPDAPLQRAAEACARLATTARSGAQDRGRRLQRRLADWRTDVSGVTASALRILSASRPRRAAFAPFAGLTVASASPSTGSPISFPIITTQRGSCAASYATTAIGLPDALAIPRSWNVPSNTSEPVTDIIESIRPFGIEPVYDLSITNTHNFVANGLYCHNTRWHDDDIIGRHIDPTSPFYNEEEATSWHQIALPALAETNDPLGRQEGEPLWEARFGVKFLEDMRRNDERGFTSLYQCRPTPAEGAFFKAEYIRTYQRMADLPVKESLRFYGASDLAVSTKQINDKSCLMIIGVDEAENLWIMPDVVWARMPSNIAVERMLKMMVQYRPLIWWAEAGVIAKSIGPFLRKRMIEENVFCAIDELVPVQDKLQRAQSINSRMSMGKVFFPGFPRWWGEAKEQLLKFPRGSFDDFVDTLSLIGLGLLKQRPARLIKKPQQGPKPMTLAWVKELSKKDALDRRATRSGWL
jgi:predicted phage terminase large subunit-like protein